MQLAVISGASCGGSAQPNGAHAKPESYTAYEIRSGTGITKRRYSEFELLQAHLIHAYPFAVIPPIPEKHRISNVLTTYLGLKKAQVVNQQIVQHRIRLLQTFIDFIQSHPSLSKDAVFIRFISEDPSWVQLGVLPNCLLYASGKAEAVYSESPEQSAAKSAEAVNPKHAEVFERVGSLQDILEGLEKSQGKIHKGYKDSMKAYGDLGMAFNAFSLEYTPLQKELDRMGQNVDETSTELQEQVTASELLEEGIRICIDFCQAAKRTISNYSKIETPPENFELETEINLVYTTIEGILDKLISESVSCHTRYQQNVSKVWNE